MAEIRKSSDKYIFNRVMIKGNVLQVVKNQVLPTHKIAHEVFAS